MRASLDPLLPVSTGTSTSAAPPHRGVDWLAGARVSIRYPLHHKLPWAVPGFYVVVLSPPSPIRCLNELFIRPPSGKDIYASAWGRRKRRRFTPKYWVDTSDSSTGCQFAVSIGAIIHFLPCLASNRMSRNAQLGKAVFLSVKGALHEEPTLWTTCLLEMAFDEEAARHDLVPTYLKLAFGEIHELAKHVSRVK